MLYLGVDQHKSQLTVNLRGEDGNVILKHPQNSGDIILNYSGVLVLGSVFLVFRTRPGRGKWVLPKRLDRSAGRE